MTITVYYDKENHLHRGNRESSECPERINAILKSLLALSSRITVSALDSKPSKSRETFDSVNCHVCTFPINMATNRCEMCGSVSSHLWKYTNEVDGDTTYVTPYTQSIVERAGKIVGTTADLISTTSVHHKSNLFLCLTRPPGHHSCEDKRRGFCHHNFAIDALDVFTKHKKRAVILDIDAHHGDGTEMEIEKRDEGLYISLHVFGENIYPGTGGVSTKKSLNIPLEPNTSSEVWLEEYFNQAIPKIKEYSPDVVIVSAGFDGHACDKIAPLNLNEDTYLQVGESLKALNLPILAILEGGYNLDVLGPSVSSFCKPFT